MMAPGFPDGAPQRDERREQMTRLLVVMCRLLTPPGLSPEATRRWARLIVGSTLLVAGGAIVLLFAGGFAVILAPDRSHLLKWPGVLFLSLLGWRFVHFFPQVWQNRRDDRFAVIFVALLIAGWAFEIVRVLAD